MDIYLMQNNVLAYVFSRVRCIMQCILELNTLIVINEILNLIIPSNFAGQWPQSKITASQLVIYDTVS